MKVFQCHQCNHPAYFENTICLNCGTQLGFLPSSSSLVSLYSEEGHFSVLGNPEQKVKRCSNYKYDVCNWLINENENKHLCKACELNEKIPNLNIASNKRAWQKTENAKHRLIYSLLRLGLFVESKFAFPRDGLAFEFLSDKAQTFGQKEPIRTGHQNGTITVNMAEADSVHVELTKNQMGEVYRTLIGHFRHESGHYYWDRLVYPDQNVLFQFRNLFGDERLDYKVALKNYYELGPQGKWSTNFISAYASAHPWEDWAESWAHYLHVIDTLETAYSFGMKLEPRLDTNFSVKVDVNFDPYEHQIFDLILQDYLPVTYAVNSINRSMGQPDLYPFIIPPAVVNKLRFIHNLVHGIKSI